MESSSKIDDKIDYGPMLTQLINEADKISTTWRTIEDVKHTVDNFIQESFTHFITYHSDIQQNTAFKKTLLSSLQNIIMTAIHNKIFSFIVEKNQSEDGLIYKKCCDLSALKVTPDQLGALEDYCIPLPATVVELASLDMHESAADKIKCLSTAFDLAMAELKGAMVDVIAQSCDNSIPVLNVSDITPILATIVIHAKPMYFISNLFFIENFYFMELTNTESECLLAFKTAVDKIKVITTDLLLPRSNRIYCDIGLEDVFKLTSDLDDKYDRKGQRICTLSDPLERHIEQFTSMITASTFNNVHM